MEYFISAAQSMLLQKLLLLALLANTPLFAHGGDITTQPTYTFGVVPQHSPVRLAQKWMPIFQYVEQQTGIKIFFKTAPSIVEFNNRLLAEEYDFIYASPSQYINAEKSTDYQAFAKAKDNLLTGIIVVRKDSNITSIEELHGKALAFPSPIAFAATLLTKAHLDSHQIAYQERIVQSHDSVYHNVVDGNFVAGGGIKRTLNNMPEVKRQQLRILVETKGYTPHAFAARKGLNQQHLSQVLKALSTLDLTDKGAALLKNINFKAIEAASPKDWDDTRAILPSVFPPTIHN